MLGKTEITPKKVFLLLVREIYLFFRNLLGLFCHPYKTLRVIARERDYSQATLLFGLPFYTLTAGLVFIIGTRFLIHAPAAWGPLAKFLLLLLVLLFLLSFSYLCYWLIKILVPPRRRDRY